MEAAVSGEKKWKEIHYMEITYKAMPGSMWPFRNSNIVVSI
jgi:hypothetical protein